MATRLENGHFNPYARDNSSGMIEAAHCAAFTNPCNAGQAGNFERLEAGSVSESTNPFKFINEFYEANANLLCPPPRDFSDIKSVEDSVNGYTESAQAVVKGLQALSQLHPFITVAVGAFVVIITLDLSRRDNDRKVHAIRLQMQDLMTVFFELRHVHNSQEAAPDGLMIADQLGGLMIMIAKDVKASKTVKAAKYEARLSDFVTTFSDHRQKLEMAFALHTTLGVDAANSIKEKLNMIALFRKLDTPREREIQKFIKEHGRVKACLNNDELLEELIVKRPPEHLQAAAKELMEDVDKTFARNMVLFERKLNMQSKPLTETIQSESDHIISTLLSGAHDQIIDPDLQKIWKDMGWKGSVKARHFVLALHDYYTDKLSKHNSDPPTVDRRSLVVMPPPPCQPRSAQSAVSNMKRQDDKWALAYINAAYIQPILEAVDDDGTGFVSVKEVNTFVASRPEGWSLPTWIAYWAVGWQASISLYKNKIYGLVQTMFQTLEHILPSNRRVVDEYLFHPSFWHIELLLRSTQSSSSKILSDPDLARITEMYTVVEEERLDMTLQDVNYELDTTATVSLITGEGRIERYVFPLIYLLLRRHLKVMMLGCKHVLDTEELATLNESLVSVLLLVDYCVQNLEAVFKQTHLDVQACLSNFAFGIFQLSYGDIKRVPIQNSFATWVDEDENTTKEVITPLSIKTKISRIPLAILKYADQKQIIGKGEDFGNTFSLTGRVSRTRTGYNFEFVLVDDDELSRTASGHLDTSTNTINLSWSDRRQKENPEEPYYRPIQMRKTPPSLLRYRYTPQRFLEDPVRARWAFAGNAALHQAQEKLWSRRFFKARFMERKRFVELSTRCLIVTMGLTPQKPLTSAENGELEHLRRDLNPSEARFYQALCEFEIQKLPWHPAWGCDWCERRITKCRVLCIQCMAEDLSDNINLCAVCLDKSPSKRGFTHDISHDMVKVEETLHDFHFAQVVESAHATINRIKGIFRTIESSTSLDAEHALVKRASLVEDTRHEPTCACCNRRLLIEISYPERDTFVCIDCDVRRLKSIPNGPSPGHKLNHPLIKVRDASIAGADATTEERLAILQQRLVSMEHKLTSSLAAIDAKVEDRLANLKHRIEQRLATFEANSELRFDTMEAVLRQLVAQTAALPSAYAQVMKEQLQRNSLPPTPATSPPPTTISTSFSSIDHFRPNHHIHIPPRALDVAQHRDKTERVEDTYQVYYSPFVSTSHHIPYPFDTSPPRLSSSSPRVYHHPPTYPSHPRVHPRNSPKSPKGRVTRHLPFQGHALDSRITVSCQLSVINPFHHGTAIRPFSLVQTACLIFPSSFHPSVYDPSFRPTDSRPSTLVIRDTSGAEAEVEV
ncbi:unnamed protein product [Cyclocybe aegerita]|uniref:EF-hand domain-containing protein n=1 Tax=Cyclocybe aegerita TaxID=1973307 RepID=A0A8S0WFM8_CYCAE|nr:unnamed protein product [Cyclocybe aegerita]